MPRATAARAAAGTAPERTGDDLTLDVPPGTIVRDAATGLVLRDLVEPGDTVCVARGGKGGFGNKHFATAVNRSPREWEKGEDGEERTVALELKLIADVGLVGLPNAGKSSLLSRVSAAHPKIAAYPFTTLEPQLGIADMGDARPLVIADLPGLIEGAHAGHGLGDEFLRHIERTRVICHVVDMAPLAGPDPVAAYRTIRKELRLYSRELARKRHVIAANKMDLTDADGEPARAQTRRPRPGLPHFRGHRDRPAPAAARSGQGGGRMLLTVSLGNTNVSFGLFERRPAAAPWPVAGGGPSAARRPDRAAADPPHRAGLRRAGLTDRAISLLSGSYQTAVLVAGRDLPYGIEIQCERAGAGRRRPAAERHRRLRADADGDYRRGHRHRDHGERRLRARRVLRRRHRARPGADAARAARAHRPSAGGRL